MSIDSTADFSIDRENKKVIVKRSFAASVPDVWKAFTTSEVLDQWWAPHPWKARTKSMDFREGGRWIYAMVGPNGEEHWSFADYKTIHPQKSYTLRDGFSDDKGNVNKEMPQSDWDVQFSAIKDGSEVVVTISYDDVEQLDSFIKMGFKEGFTIALQGLDAYFAKKK